MKYGVYGGNKGKQTFWSRKVSEWSSGVGSADFSRLSDCQESHPRKIRNPQTSRSPKKDWLKCLYTAFLSLAFWGKRSAPVKPPKIRVLSPKNPANAGMNQFLNNMPGRV